MNDFNIVLPVGTHGIYKATCFFKGYLPSDNKVPESGRTFVIAGGPGREPTPGSRKLTGRWLDDKAPDTIESSSLEAVIVGGRRIKQIVTGDSAPDPTPITEEPVHDHQDAEPQKPTRRKR